MHQKLSLEFSSPLPQKRRPAALRPGFSTLVFATLLLGGCRCERSQVGLADVVRCEHGIEGAMAKSDVNEAMRAYYRECAGVYAQPTCKRAFTSAADLSVSEQMPKVVRDCRTAYCPLFQTRVLEICQPDWQLTRVNIRRSWPALHDAILSRDAGPYAARLRQAMLMFYARIAERTGTEAATEKGDSE